MLHGLGTYFITDVSAQLFGPIFKGQEVQEEFNLVMTMVSLSCRETSVINLLTPRHIPQARTILDMPVASVYFCVL
jgi:hypothetical protein